VQKKKLWRLLKKQAFFRRRVRLSSGKVSNYYIDVRRVSLTGEGISLISHLIWDLIKDDKVTAIGGPTLGADPIIGGVCFLAYKKGKKLKGFIVRKVPKRHGRRKLIEGAALSSKDRVVLIDDVATTGSSLFKAIEILKKENIKIVKIIVVVDRKEGAYQLFSNLGYPFVALFTRDDFL